MSAMRATLSAARKDILVTLVLASAVSLGLLAGRMWATQTTTYWFLAWNLLLAWVPLFLGWWLLARLRTTRWPTARNITLTLLWLGFLPNTFYISSDLIHLSIRTATLYDVVMFLSFTFSGFVLGYLSLFGLQTRFKQSFGSQKAWGFASASLLLCSFAIYLGRYLRWNSWDILLNPAGLIFDVSEPFVNPGSHPQVFTTTLMFFILLGSIYVVSYRLVRQARQSTI